MPSTIAVHHVFAHPSVTPTPSHIQSLHPHDRHTELSFFNITLAELSDLGVPTTFLEYGVGGGGGQDGNDLAKDAEEAARNPYFGIFGSYNASRDPWKKPDVKAYQREFYDKTAQYLTDGCANQTYEIGMGEHKGRRLGVVMGGGGCGWTTVWGSCDMCAA